MTSPYQSSNTPADPRHSSRLGVAQRFYLLEVLSGLKLTAFASSPIWRGTRSTSCSASRAPTARDHSVPRRAASLFATAPQPAPARATGRRLSALCRVHDVRDGLPRPLHLHRGHRAPRIPRSRRCPSASIIDLGKCVFCGYCVRGLSRGRHPQWTRDTGVLVLQPRGDDLTKETLLALEPAGHPTACLPRPCPSPPTGPCR